MESKAATNKTYYIRLYGEEYYASDVLWKDGDSVWAFPASMIDSYINDGDNVVIYTGGKRYEHVFTKNIGELQIHDMGFTMVTAPSYETVHIWSDAKAAVNGDIQTAFVYDGGTANFNNNVNTLYMYEVNMKEQNVNVLGTVGCVQEYKANEGTMAKYYNFSAGACVYKQGSLQAQAGTFTLDPGAYVPAVPTVPGTPGNGGNDLDDVPKTGELNLRMSILFLALSAFCTTGAYVLYRKKA